MGSEEGEDIGCVCGPMIGWYFPSLSELNDSLEKEELDPIDGTFVAGMKCLRSLTQNLRAGFSFAGWRVRSEKMINDVAKEVSLTFLLPTLVALYKMPFGKCGISVGVGVGYYPVWYTKEVTDEGGTTITRMKGGNIGGQIMLDAQYSIKANKAIAGEISYVIGKMDKLYRAGSEAKDAPKIDLEGLLIRIGFRRFF
jgi:hypothetical protein